MLTRTRRTTIAIVVLIALLITAFGATVGKAVLIGNSGDKGDDYIANVAEGGFLKASADTVEVKDWARYYNTELQTDEWSGNEYNFGASPYVEGADAAYYDAEFRERLQWDPALAAADMAWLDANLGTRKMGKFYASISDKWMEEVNAAKDTFAMDQDSYYKMLDCFLDSLNKAAISIRTCDDVMDMMYMDPDTETGVPDIIYLPTDEHAGTELVYTFIVKGDINDGNGEKSKEANTIEVAYRIDCGFQPTNVAEIVPEVVEEAGDSTPAAETKTVVAAPKATSDKGSTPKSTPSKGSTTKSNPNKGSTPSANPSKGSTPKSNPTTPSKPSTTPTKPSGPSTTPTESKADPTPNPDPTPTPTPTPDPTPSQNVKDQSKKPTTNTEPNDNKGPGESTNSGKGATTSTKDATHQSETSKTTSTDYSSYDEYRKDVESKKQTNATQKTGGSSNESSTKSSSSSNSSSSSSSGSKSGGSTKVDSNAEKGTGNGGADQKTPVSAPAKEAGTGKSVSSEGAGEAWSGPAD